MGDRAADRNQSAKSVVTTVGERCRRCYTCVRHCPAKAIRVQDGRAQVLPERCIACGTCIRVCAQTAKRIETESLETAKALVAAGEETIACLAPSFPAFFAEARPGQVVAAARRLGFSGVMEVAVGAELVANACRQLFAHHRGDTPLVTTPCPAIVSYVEKHLPELLPSLAPIVSPMVALGRLIKQRLHPHARVVFIGPCLAKKVEAQAPELDHEIDAVLTFRGFTEWLSEEGVEVSSLPEEEFDGPHPTFGRIFPVPGGLLRASAMEADVLDDDIVVTEGVERVMELLRQLEAGNVRARFFDLLFCEGCISGPFAGDPGNTVAMKQRIAHYTREAVERYPSAELEQHYDLDLSRRFSDCRVEVRDPSEEEIRAILHQTDKHAPEDELNCGACGYSSCREKAVAVYNGLAESEMCLPYLIDRLEKTVVALDQSRQDLVAAHGQLVQSERLASMGQLAAGVAHEINNPLGTVLLYAHTILGEVEGSNPLRADVKVIAAEADRCRTIVRGLLDFARARGRKKERTDLGPLLQHVTSLVDKQPLFARVAIELQVPEDLPPVDGDHDQLTQAFVNLCTNAAEAMEAGGTLRIWARPADQGRVEICFRDTGAGIPEEHLGKLFTPFFTTKAGGKGTGLGLAIVYGIVKSHRGDIRVESAVGEGTTFTITLNQWSAAERDDAAGAIGGDQPAMIGENSDE